MLAGAIRIVLAGLLAAPPPPDDAPPLQRPAPTVVPRRVNAPAPAPAVEPTPAPAPAPAPTPTPAPVVDSAPADVPPPGTGLLVGGSAAAGAGLLVGSAGLLLSIDPQSGGVPVAMMGVGTGLLAAGGVLLGVGIHRKVARDRWVRRTGVRAPRTGHGLLVGGALLGAASIALLAASADLVRRSPRRVECEPEETCADRRGDSVLGVAVGVLLLGGAATLLGVGGRRKLRAARRPVAGVGWVPGGALAGIGGRF